VKALDTTLFATTLLLVPALGWWAGRAMGRRNWGILAVLLASILVALMPNLARLSTLALVDGRPLTEFGATLIQRAAATSEIGLFFLALSVFMTMLGWTSTPVATRPD
jgi:hypothetical protein